MFSSCPCVFSGKLTQSAKPKNTWNKTTPVRQMKYLEVIETIISLEMGEMKILLPPHLEQPPNMHIAYLLGKQIMCSSCLIIFLVV